MDPWVIEHLHSLKEGERKAFADKAMRGKEEAEDEVDHLPPFSHARNSHSALTHGNDIS